MNPIVLTFPGPVPASAREHIQRSLEEWDRHKPLVLAEGGQISTVGGLTFTVRLSGGPLEGVAFTITLPSLVMPPYFEASGGRYVRWVDRNGETEAQIVGAQGEPYYQWEAA